MLGLRGGMAIWDGATGRLLQTLEGHEGPVRSVAWASSGRLAVATTTGAIDLWDLSGREPRRLARFVTALAGLVVTGDGFVDGPSAALEGVRFADGWALYDLEDLPERHAPERVRAALRGPGASTPD